MLFKKRSLSALEYLVLISLVAVFALGSLPKFSHLTNEAKKVSNKQLADAFQKALTDAHTAWMGNKTPNAKTGSYVFIDGQRVHVNHLGWPDYDSDLTPSSNDCAFLWNSLLSNAPIAGCENCHEHCDSQATNGCYITTTQSGTCIFTLCNDVSVQVSYNVMALR